MKNKLIIALAMLLSMMAVKAQTANECLDFLYAYMPQPDKADYSHQFYEENVKTTLQAKAEMTWGSMIPRREFMHFVLPVRVNNEHLDNSRMVFFEELKTRIKGMTMSETVLEVNHWCHEKATYTPSDERTSSPLATVRTAYGRCGEESTFLVAALRSVCIPARQVYTPRWAHTDDNHAWVEAWADGEWHFLGACEPEAVLDLGWFNAPASRGMLMHTKAFGNYDGSEEVIQRNKCFTEIDVTSNYAPVSRREVKVVNENGVPVEGATVEFKIYNYAEFYTVSTKKTDANGMTYMQAGKGDLLAWAYKDDLYGFEVCTMDKDEELVVTLNHLTGTRFSADVKVVPPVERNTVPFMTDEQRACNISRLAVEDSIRNAYVATFPNSDNVFIKKSRGNHACIASFLDNKKLNFAPESLLSVISDKDLRDVPMEVLLDANNTPVNKGYTQEIYDRYVLNPRVASEHLTPYKGYFAQNIGKGLKNRFKSISSIILWTKKNISINEETNPQHLRMTPIGVWESKECDRYSRNIFFVAMCRAMGHAARIDLVTNKVEIYENNDWQEVKFEAKSSQMNNPKGTLQATYVPDEFILDPKYYINFTVSKLENGQPVLLNYAEEDTWNSTLKDGVKLDEGDYLITSGTRMADGSVLVHMEVIPISKNEIATAPLIMPQNNDGLKVIGNFNSENLYADNQLGTKSILSTTGRGYYVLGIIAPNNEPTNHTLRDIAAVKKEFEALNVPVILLFKDKDNLARFNLNEFPALPATTQIGTDVNGVIWNEINTGMHLKTSTLPVFVIADTFNRIVFISQGYTIGLGEQLVKHMKTLK